MKKIILTPQEKLVSIMDLKQNFFTKIKVGIRYFYKKDREYLLSLSDGWVSRITALIKEEVMSSNLNSQPGLTSDICPFCIENLHIKHGPCTKCNYGKLHGICSFEDFGHPKGGLNTWGSLVKIYNGREDRPTYAQFLNILN